MTNISSSGSDFYSRCSLVWKPVVEDPCYLRLVSKFIYFSIRSRVKHIMNEYVSRNKHKYTSRWSLRILDLLCFFHCQVRTKHNWWKIICLTKKVHNHKINYRHTFIYKVSIKIKWLCLIILPWDHYLLWKKF